MVFRIGSSLLLCLVLALFGAGFAVAQPSVQQVVRVDPVVRDAELFIDTDVEFNVSDELRNAMLLQLAQSNFKNAKR